MDEGLKEAIAATALANPTTERPFALEELVDIARQCQSMARKVQADPARAEQFLKLAHKSGRSAARFLRPGGELRERLLSGELMSVEEWERLCGPSPPPPEMRLLQP
jgi:hypothetical protein